MNSGDIVDGRTKILPSNLVTLIKNLRISTSLLTLVRHVILPVTRLPTLFSWVEVPGRHGGCIILKNPTYEGVLVSGHRQFTIKTRLTGSSKKGLEKKTLRVNTSV